MRRRDYYGDESRSSPVDPHQGALYYLRAPDGCVAITQHYNDRDDIHVELKRDRRGDGHDHFINPNGTVIPLDVPAKIDVLKYVEEQPTYFVSDQQIDKATERAKAIYERRRKSESGESLKLKTIAKKAIKELSPNLSSAIVNRCGDTIRKRLNTWIEKKHPDGT